MELEGEPGIGKTRLLAELAARADDRGHLVLTGSASELERELPFWVFVDALDDYVRGLPPVVLERLPAEELARVLPPAGGVPRSLAVPDERHRAHEAIRALLGVLAARQPLVLVLDDLHWADSGSLELLGALLRRPPPGPVLLALAVRPRQVPERLRPALERAHRAGTLTRLSLAALTPDEARDLLGTTADAVYEDSGGNPFYLQQLARAVGRSGALPRDVTAALSEELALLSEPARLLLQGAAVAGDPFAPELAAAAAGAPFVPDPPRTSPATAAPPGVATTPPGVADELAVLDELLAADLVRVTDVPRRFRFRHPLVRRAVYDAAPGGWRLGAHERAAAALAAAGAPPGTRAHHVERYARLGDLQAVGVLRDAGLAADTALPETAAHWFAAALALLPQDADGERLGLLVAHARALAQVGDFTAAREALITALRTKGQTPYVRARMIAGCATAERLLGRYDEARARVRRGLDELPDQAGREGVLLMAELAVDGFLRTDWPLMWEWGRKALAAARTLDDPPALAASTAMAALGDAFAGRIDDAQRHCDAASRLVDALPDEQFAQRVDAGLHLMGAELYLDRLADALRHGQRALDVGRATGQGNLFPILVPALGACYELCGRVPESAALLDDAVEAARLSGNRQALSLALMNRCATTLSLGDLEAARAYGEEALAVARDLGNQLARSFSGFTLAQVLAEAGEPERARAQLLDSGGGPDLPRMPYAWRAGGFELLARCGAPGAAERCAAHAEDTGLAFAAAQALSLHDPLAAADRLDALGLPVYAARVRVRAAARLDRTPAIEQLERAAQTFERCGATKRREAAERELRRLGRTVYRRSGASGVDDLTARELEIARLVVDRQTNTQIAQTLFLSKKTVETHLRNIFAKAGVSSRVELARAVERADRG